MKITVEYESHTMLPDELTMLIEKMRKSIQECRNEPDKIECSIGSMKSGITLWLVKNRSKVEL
jgi:hypothetical protein